MAYPNHCFTSAYILPSLHKERRQRYRQEASIYDGVKLGVHWQMTHVEFANDVVHLHDIEQ